MKKIIILLIVCTLGVGGYLYYDRNIKKKPIEENVNVEEMKELPKLAFRELRNYIVTNDLKTIGKNSGEFDIRKVNIGKDSELYLDSNSYYYVTDGNIYMYVEYIYDNKYKCKMTISDDEDNIAGFSYHLIDKEIR